MTRAKSTKPSVRCAIYARVSSEEGLGQEFNSLHAQRESGEAYVLSQASEGWACLLERYDDGGYTGGNTERPALKRLMADIEAGRVDCVIVYKVDRLSRSLLDFARLLQIFEKHNVSFCAVTQAFSTTSSVGRLTMNMLLSFAQFERELVSERTRDKIAAARRKGKWGGGHALLGYDVDPVTRKLVMNEDEAGRVRQIFDLYLKHESLLAVVSEIESRGWRNKEWTTRKGTLRGGRRFDKCSVFKLLTNPVYIGRVKHKSDTFPGEHAGIVDEAVFLRVQDVLRRNGRSGGAIVRNKYNGLLRGLVRCRTCECAMSHSYSSSRNGKVKYRYYVCLQASKRGWHTCPGPSIPAGEIEQFVIDRVKEIARDPRLIEPTLRQARKEADTQLKALGGEQTILEREQRRCHAELRRAAVSPDAGLTTMVADLNDRLRVAEQRLGVIQRETAGLRERLVSEDEVASALAEFDAMWDALAPREQAEVLRLLVRGVEYDGKAHRIKITFHPTGLHDLARSQAPPQKEVAA